MSLKRVINKLNFPRPLAEVEPDVRLWVAEQKAEEPVLETAAHGLASLNQVSNIPELPDGRPITDTRFDIWLSYRIGTW